MVQEDFRGLLPSLSQQDPDWLGSEERPVYTLCPVSWCLLALQSGQSVWIIASDLVAYSLGHRVFLHNWQIYLAIFKSSFHSLYLMLPKRFPLPG